MALDQRPNIPTIVGGARVLYYARLDERHMKENGSTVPYGLAICDLEDKGVLLFTCEDDWIPIFNSRHETVGAAKRRASFEYPGVDVTWAQAPS
jgi:hypothetical protein